MIPFKAIIQWSVVCTRCGGRMTASAPLSQALTRSREIETLRALVVLWQETAEQAQRDGDQEIEALNAQLAHWMREAEALRISHDRADGALADAETVPTGDTERGIRLLTAERDAERTRYVLANAGWKEADRQRLDAEAQVEALTEKRRQEIRIVQEAINALHGIAKTEAERDGLKNTLAAWHAECGEGGPRPIKDNVRALAEALVVTRKYVEDRWATWKEPMALDRLRQIDAALARPGVVGGREEEG